MAKLRVLLPGVLVCICAGAGAVRAPGCAVSGVGATGSDVALATAACESARGRFAELFGGMVPPVEVVLHEGAGYRVTSAGEVGLVFWPTSAALASRLGTGSGVDRQLAVQWRDVLPHEIMHALTVARFYRTGELDGHAGYGTPLPDWFEEAVGIWGEPVESRRTRVAQARQRADLPRSLESILLSPHPAASNRTLLSARSGAPLPADDALWSFYPRAIAVLTFVHEQGGRAAVSELARRLVENPANERALVALPGLPTDFGGVVRAWEKWVSE